MTRRVYLEYSKKERTQKKRTHICTEEEGTFVEKERAVFVCVKEANTFVHKDRTHLQKKTNIRYLVNLEQVRLKCRSYLASYD